MNFGPTQILAFIRDRAATRALALAVTAGTAGVVGTIVVASQGCTVLVNDAPLDDSGTGSYGSCAECQYQTCIGQWSVCGGSAECMAIYTCATARSCDQSCVDQCYLSHPTGQAPYYALASCDSQAALSTTCTTLCSATQPDAGTTGDGAASPDADLSEAGDAASSPDGDDSSTPDASTDDVVAPPPPDAAGVQSCSDCTSQKCASAKAACAQGTPCDLYTNCLGACTDSACVIKCGTDNAAGKTASGALGDCVTQSCPHECGLGQ